MSPSSELLYVSLQLTALAEATPAENFSWRPEPGVRSTSELYMHIVTANFHLLNTIGVDPPVDMRENMEKSVTAKADAIMWLKRSLDAVKTDWEEVRSNKHPPTPTVIHYSHRKDRKSHEMHPEYQSGDCEEPTQ